MTALHTVRSNPVCAHARYVYVKHFSVAACLDCKVEFLVSEERSERDQNHEWVNRDS